MFREQVADDIWMVIIRVSILDHNGYSAGKAITEGH